MRFFTSTLFAIVAIVSAVMAAENPIIQPDGSVPMVAGKPFTITWTPTTSGTITLILRQGPSNDLHDVETIVSGAPNSGTFTWTPETSLPAGSNYAIMITDSQGNTNYTPLISIDSNTAPSSSSSSSSVEPTSTSASASTSHSKTSHNKTTESSTSTTPAESSTTSSSMSVPGNSTTLVTSMTATMSSNTTVTGTYGNSTSSSASTTARSSGASPSKTPSSSTPVPTGAAAGLLKSPLALVVCLLGAVVYLN